jgi:hypothetical protein
MRPVPANLSPLIRLAFEHCPLAYRAWGNAEHVYAAIKVVPIAQNLALDSYVQSAEWPTVEEIVEQVIALTSGTLDARTMAGREFVTDPDDAHTRAAKLVYDAWAELDAISQCVDISGGLAYLHDSGDTVAKVDCVFYPPRRWMALVPSIRLAFSRRTPDQLEDRERARELASKAMFEFRVPLSRCDWVGVVACFPTDEVRAQLDELRGLFTVEQGALLS